MKKHIWTPLIAALFSIHGQSVAQEVVPASTGTNCPPLVIEVSETGIATAKNTTFSLNNDEALSSFLHKQCPSIYRPPVIIQASGGVPFIFDQKIIRECSILGFSQVSLVTKIKGQSDRTCPAPIHPECIDYAIRLVETQIAVHSDGTVAVNDGGLFSTTDKKLEDLTLFIKQLSELYQIQETRFINVIIPQPEATHERVMDVLEACSRAGTLEETYLYKSPVFYKRDLVKPQIPSPRTERPQPVLKKLQVPAKDDRKQVRKLRQMIITKENKAITVPKTADKTDSTSRFYIDLVEDEQGIKIFIPDREEPVSIEELKSIVTEQISSDPDIQITLCGDADISFEDTENVMKACAESGAHNMIFETKRKRRTQPQSSIPRTHTAAISIEARIQIEESGRVILNDGTAYDASDTKLKGLTEQLVVFQQVADAEKSSIFVTLDPAMKIKHKRIVEVMDACAAANVKNLTFIRRTNTK